MEKQVSGMVWQKGQEANKLAESTYTWLLLFSISGGLLTLAALFTIFRYLSNARKYQVALEQAKLEAESLARTKELFMANISHEIRTPVTAISGFTAQLLQDPLDEKSLQSLRIIKSSSDHLARMIDDILDFTKLQNGKLKLEEVHFSLDQVIDEVVCLFEHQAREKKNSLLVSLAPETEHYLVGDPYRLKQILINLVSNAIKFTSFGTVVIAVNTEKSNNEQLNLELTVTDTGIGIDEDKLDIIFNEFTQAEMSTTRKYGGTGLGLSIVKKILELQHGSIECESRKNFGTKITCRIPFLTGKEELALKSVSTDLSVPAWLTDISVLVVDDEIFNRQLFQKIFQRWNIRCDLAQSSMDAFELLKSTRYDILFMDVRMPGIDGLKAARFIRDNLNIDESVTKIICISAAIVNEEQDIYRIAGMNGILPKPFTEEMLLESVLTVLNAKPAIPATDSVSKREQLQKTTGKINLDSLKHIAANDKEFVSQMIQAFILTTTNGISEMEEALKLQNRDKLTELAHKLTPPCRHIGAKELESLFKKIESSAIGENVDQLENLLKKTINEADNVFDLLREQLSSL
jgi:signal transduction histidine kinase/DNA-binding response OmpR family regulator